MRQLNVFQAFCSKVGLTSCILTTAIGGQWLVIAPTQAAPIGNLDTLTQQRIEQSYYFDWNRNSAYRTALSNMFRSNNMALPSWLRKGNGPSLPAKIEYFDGARWVLLNTCKQHDCDNNITYILFHPESRSIGGIAKFNGQATWLGRPNTTMQSYLRQTSKIQ